MKLLLTPLILICLGIPASSHFASAAPPVPQEEFERIIHLGLEDLTREASDLLESRYPAEEWEDWSFPDFVFTNEPSEIGYKIAAKEPALLGPSGSEEGVPCYCFCESIGHESLLACFLKGGEVGGEFDEHGAYCTICYGQAMMALLLDEAGAGPYEIKRLMSERFADLVEKHRR